jgi:hypothetical protein
MVATRSSPVKKNPKAIESEAEQELEEDVAPEEVAVQIDESEGLEQTLEPSDKNPPKLFILPKDTDREARIVTLSDPASGTPSRYFIYPEKGLFEFTRVAAPKSEPRSVLLAPAQNGDQPPDPEEHSEARGEEQQNRSSTLKGYISKSADIFVATSVDPIFHLIPILAPASAKNQKRLFVTFDDHLDSVTGTLRQLLQQCPVRKHFESRLDSICDKVEAGDESMYRLSTDKLASLLVSKARRMVKNGLPASMEERFIRQALQAPILSIKREHTTMAADTVIETDTQAGADNSQTSPETATTKDSQSTTFSQVSATTSMTSIAISQDTDVLTDTPAPSNEASDEVKHLLRLRTALQYVQTCYIPVHIRSALTAAFSKLIDFTTLDTHLKYLDSLHEEARALRALSDNVTRKRGLDDDEAAVERAEKKSKKEEEEKRKKM